MSEESAAQANQAQNVSTVSPIQILGQYIKDLSFEVPLGAEVFSLLRKQSPEIPVSIDTGMDHIDGNTYEVTLKAQVKAIVGDKSAFILEIEYACIAEIHPDFVAQSHIHPVLLIEVPRMMFPFLRQIISDMTVNGGFPPLMLQIVDFAELYRAKFGVQAQPTQPPTLN